MFCCFRGHMASHALTEHIVSDLDETRRSIQSILNVDDIAQRIESMQPTEVDNLRIELRAELHTLAQRISTELTNLNDKITYNIIKHINYSNDCTEKMMELQKQNEKLQYEYAMVLTGNSSNSSTRSPISMASNPQL